MQKKILNTINCDDITIVYNKIRSLNLDFNLTSLDSFGYKNASLCCIDAVLSINRRYKSFVVPRISHFKIKYPQIVSLEELLDLINAKTPREFGIVCLKYNDPKRITLLKSLVVRLCSITNYNSKFEYKILKDWFQNKGILGFKELNVKGIGLATYQYLRMLFGIDTIKPDIHITSFIEGCVNRRLNKVYCIKLMEEVAKKYNVPALCLDHSIWSMLSFK